MIHALNISISLHPKLFRIQKRSDPLYFFYKKLSPCPVFVLIYLYIFTHLNRDGIQIRKLVCIMYKFLNQTLVKNMFLFENTTITILDVKNQDSSQQVHYVRTYSNNQRVIHCKKDAMEILH